MTEDECWEEHERLRRMVPGWPVTYGEVERWREALAAGTSWTQMRLRFGRSAGMMRRALAQVDEEEGR